MCRFCLNAFVDKTLTPDNDLSYLSIGFCERGRSMCIRSGDGRPTLILVSEAVNGINVDVAVYKPKFCPECGRELLENKKP